MVQVFSGAVIVGPEGWPEMDEQEMVSVEFSHFPSAWRPPCAPHDPSALHAPHSMQPRALCPSCWAPRHPVIFGSLLLGTSCEEQAPKGPGSNQAGFPQA